MGTIAGLTVTFGPIAAVIGGLVAGSPLVGLIGIAALLAMELSYLPMIRYHHLGLASWTACSGVYVRGHDGHLGQASLPHGRGLEGTSLRCADRVNQGLNGRAVGAAFWCE